MRVGPRPSGEFDIRNDAIRAGEVAATPKVHDARESARSGPVRVADRVELSETGKALSRATALSPEQVTAIRGRIAEGAYNDARVLDAVARRILDQWNT